MRYENIKQLVGVTNVTVTSELRYSELHALVDKARSCACGILTIVVKSGTLSDSELAALAKLGDANVAFDLTEFKF